LTYQRYCGLDPGLVAVAVIVTEEPAQTGFEEGEIETETGKIGLTTINKGEEVAGLLETQVPEEVSWQVTLSVFCGI
jgi:hypothetical protein